jgi:DNA repair photolyase
MQSPIKGRGTGDNREGRFESRHVEATEDGWWREEEIRAPATEVRAEIARSIIAHNNSPDLPFSQSINPYRGCEHGCIYCADGSTAILMADGGTKMLADLTVGDEIFGTARRGWYRRYVRTRVLAHWQTRKRAYRITLADGTAVIVSGDHRLLTDRGWKFITGSQQGHERRPHLSTGNQLLGFGMVSSSAPQSVPHRDTREYRRGYLCGVIRGDGHPAVYRCARAGRSNGDQHRFRLAMIDNEALERAGQYLGEFGVGTDRFLFQKERTNRQRMEAIRTGARASIEAIGRLIQWPERCARDWMHGFIAGIFDAEGSFSDGILRIANTDGRIIDATTSSLAHLGFDAVVDKSRMDTPKPVRYVRIRGGLREHLRFFRFCNPSIGRKRDISGQSVKSGADLRVVGIEPLSGERDLFDITTGTGDFVANGVISHNCYARPTHSYVNLSAGLDFETKLFYKDNAAELLESELSKRHYRAETIHLGASTDPYQPIEREHRVTRRLLEVLWRFRHPVTIITKSHLVLRDLDLLQQMAKERLCYVMVSLTTLDEDLKRGLEPRAPSPAARLKAIAGLAQAAVPVGVLAAPMIPALNDHELERILEAAADAGADVAGYVLLRLPYEVKDLFESWLRTHVPLRAEHVLSRIRAMRGGELNDPRFGARFKGTGVEARLLAQRFEIACRRFKLNRSRQVDLNTKAFRVPGDAGGQLSLEGL